VIVHVEAVMGTVASIHVVAGDLGEPRARLAIDDACALLHRHDGLFSTWDPESPMSVLRRGALPIEEVPEELAVVLELCATARTLSGGWFDASAMPGGIDPTGLVKGWSAEQALECLRAAGVRGAMVNAGGDIACHGSPGDGGPWRIGIRHPWRSDAMACIVEIDHAVATSGAYERGRHLVDPIGRTGPPPASATVSGPSLTFADAFATALAVGGDQALPFIAALDGYDAYLIRADGSEESTPGMRFVDVTGSPPPPGTGTAPGTTSALPAE